MIWGSISSAGVGPLCFWKPTVTAPRFLPRHFWSNFMLLFCLPRLFNIPDFIFQAGFCTCPHYPNAPKSCSMTIGVGVLDWPAKLTRHEPRREFYGVLSTKKMRNKRPKKCRDKLKATVKETLASHTTSAVPQTDSPPCHAELSAEVIFKGKRSLYQVLSIYTVNEHTLQKANNSLKMFFFIGLMKYSNLLR